MKNFNISALVLALGFTFSVSAMAEPITKAQYKAQEKA